ncbi:hypothetical protein M1446_00440 [Candidatus Dependentiae bacterium]|nr:hypothetical protein [Candidatus Dependentiae bacterium]
MIKKFILIISLLNFQANFCMHLRTKEYVYEQITKKTKQIVNYVCPQQNLPETELAQEIENLKEEIYKREKIFKNSSKYYAGIGSAVLLTYPLVMLAGYSNYDIPKFNMCRNLIAFITCSPLCYKIFKIGRLEYKLKKLQDQQWQNVLSKDS